MLTSRLFGTSWLFSLICAFILSGCGLISGELKQLFSNGPANVSGISVRATNPNGAYRAGQTISIEVSFPSEVVVTGSPALKLATGRSGAEATYVSGSGTDTLLFTYTIQAGDNVAELDYSSSVAISEVGGTIRSQTDAVLDLSLSTPGTSGSIRFANDIALDTTPPAVAAVSSTTANGAYKAAATVSVLTTFSEPVFVTGAPEVALNADVNAKAVYHSGSGAPGIRFDYIVGASDTSLDLDYTATNSLTVTASSIKDAAGNDAVLTLPSVGGASSLAGSSAIVIDTDLPSAVSSLDDGFGIIGTTSTPITTWNHATDATSSIATYQIAIGTTSGGTEVLGWTSQTAMNTATVTGLTLTAGTTYYTSVRAVDAAGNVGTGTTGDGWRAVNTLTIAPATKMLVTNERYPFSASQGYPGYAYSLFSGVGSLAGNVFTASSAAGSSVLRATDQMNSTADASITTRQFGFTTAMPAKLVDAQMTVSGVQYDSSGNLYVAGLYGSNTLRWLVMKYDGTAWTTLLDEATGVSSTGITGLLVNSSNDIWVTGYKYASSRHIWTVKHYDGTTWTDSDVFSLGAFTAMANGIAKGPGGEIYVVGVANASASSQRWIVRRYAAGTWTTLDNYQRNGTANINQARAVAVNSLGDIFVVGDAAASSGTNGDWVVRKYSGGSWTNSEIIDYGAGERVDRITIDSSDNVYAAGWTLTTTYEVRKLSGGVWSSIGVYTHPGNTLETVTALQTDNTGRLYATIYGYNGTAISGYVTRYTGSGTTWELVSSTPNFMISALTKNSAGEIVYAGSLDPFGYRDKDGESWSVRKTDGTTTTEIASYQTQTEASAYILDLAFDSQGNSYFVGEYTAYTGTGLGMKRWFVNKFDGTSWIELELHNPFPSVGWSTAKGIYVDESDHLWVAGYVWQSGSEATWTVRKFDGTSWSTVDSVVLPGDRAYPGGITGKAGEIYVYGQFENAGGWWDAAIRRFDGTSWSTVHVDDGYQEDANVTDLTIDSNGVAWATVVKIDPSWSVMDLEVLKSTDGTTWSVSDTRTGDELYWAELEEGVSGEIYVAFEAGLSNGDWVGIIRKWNGTTWSTFDQTADDGWYSAVARDSEGNVYFVGGQYPQMVIKKWNGHYLDTVYSPAVRPGYTSESLVDIATGPSGKLMIEGRANSSGVTSTFFIHLEP